MGAVLFAASYFLFDEAGSKIVSVIFIIIGLVLLTGKTLGDSLGKFISSIASFFGKQWQAFIEDMKQWKKEAKEKNKSQAKQKKVKEPKVEPQEEIQAAVEPAEPLISSFTDNAYDQESAEPMVEHHQEMDEEVEHDDK